MDNKNISEESHDVLKEITHDFDSNTGALLVNLETLRNINIELGCVSDDVRNTDKSNLQNMGMKFHDINHKVDLLADLLYYTLQDLEETYEHTRLIKESYFDLIVREGR